MFRSYTIRGAEASGHAVSSQVRPPRSAPPTSQDQLIQEGPARPAARLTAVVVFPTPPLWLAIAILRMGWASLSARRLGDYAPSLRVPRRGPRVLLSASCSVFSGASGRARGEALPGVEIPYPRCT